MVQFGIATDQRVDLAGLGFFVEIDAEIRQGRIFLTLRPLTVLALRAGCTLLRPANPAVLGRPTFGDAVGNEIDSIQPAHFLLLKEICCVAFSLRKNRHQYVGTGDLFAAG